MGHDFQPETGHFEPLSKEKQKLIRSLSRKKGRMQHKLFLAEGARLVEDVLLYPHYCRFVYGSRTQLDRLETAVPRFLYNGQDLFLTENSQQIGAVVDIVPSPSTAEFFTLEGPLIVLDALSDPGNAGTILRAADWCGLNGVGCMEGSVDLWNPKSVRATMGALLRTAVVGNLTPRDLRDAARSVYILDAGGEISVGRDRLDPQGVYVIGNEAHGVSKGLREIADGVVSIPGVRGESLNAAMAATILAHELYRTIGSV